MALYVALLQLAGRLLKYSYHMARVSSWIEHRMRAALTKNMVFPGVCAQRTGAACAGRVGGWVGGWVDGVMRGRACTCDVDVHSPADLAGVHV